MEILGQGWEAAAAVLRVDLLGRLLLATLLGGLIGWERESGGKAAGLRTNILICVGAALLTDLSIRFVLLAETDLVRADPARIAAQIVSGIGFLGAGTIIQARGSISGLTTAATIWVVAAIGMAVGSGHHVEAAGSTVLVLVVLYPLGMLEVHLARSRKKRQLRVELERGPGQLEAVTEFLEKVGLRVDTERVDLEGDRVLAVLALMGRESEFVEARKRLLERSEIRGFELG